MGGVGPLIEGAEAESVLGWWLDAGVDTLVAEQPRNWLAPSTEPAPAEVTEPAEHLPDSLQLFREWIATSPHAPLASSRSKPVLPTGPEQAEIMLLAEAPGRDEARDGLPIAGEAWALTQRMLAAIGYWPDQAYVANLAFFHAPGEKLSAEQLRQCGEIARRHIALARPKRLLLLGDTTARALLGKAIPQARGHVHRIEGTRTVATFAPRTLLEQPSQKALAWKDLQLLMEEQP